MKSYSTITLTGLLMLAFISPALAEQDNPHKLIINRITRGNRFCNRIYNNFPIKSHGQFLNPYCKKWGAGRIIDLLTGDKQQVEQSLCEPKVNKCGSRSGR